MSVQDRTDLGLAADLFKVLAAPLRLAILEALTIRPHCVHELVEVLEVAQPLVSQHLRVLRTTHLVRGTRRGREVAYELRDEHVAHIVRDAITHAQEDQP